MQEKPKDISSLMKLSCSKVASKAHDEENVLHKYCYLLWFCILERKQDI